MSGKDETTMMKVVIDEARCKGCALCTVACPRELVQLETQINRLGYRPALVAPEDQVKCTSCALCARMCPDLAITIYRAGKEAQA